MKKIYQLLVLLFFIFVLTLKIDANEFKTPKVAIIQSQFDNIDKLLTRYKIPFTLIKKHRELETEALYKKYDVLFLPCGIESSLKTSINLLARGRQLEGLSISEEYYSLDHKLTGKLLKEFIDNGGIAYFADFSCKYLESALDCVEYYDNFRHMGMEGWLKFKVSGELKSYQTGAIKNGLYVPHQGWVIPKTIKGGELVLSARAETPRGAKDVVLGSIIKHGDGEAIYTGLHGENKLDNIMRFLIFRTVYARVLKETNEYLDHWSLAKLTSIVDKSVKEDTHRSYSFNIDHQLATFYFFPKGGVWQLDFFDNDGNLFYSKNNIKEEYRLKIPNVSGKMISVKIFDQTNEKNNLYTAVTAGGERVIPYLKLVFIVLAGIVLLVIIILLLRGRSYSGRIRF